MSSPSLLFDDFVLVVVMMVERQTNTANAQTPLVPS